MPLPIDLPTFIDKLVELNIYISPEWELEIFNLGKMPTADRLGYPRIWLGGKKGSYKHLHRILTDCPDGLVVDHINRDPTDCSVWDLRICSHSENQINRKITSKTGVTGVSQDSISGLWVSQIYVNGRRHRKKFKSFDEAVEHRKNLERKHYRSFHIFKDYTSGI